MIENYRSEKVTVSCLIAITSQCAKSNCPAKMMFLADLSPILYLHQRNKKWRHVTSFSTLSDILRSDKIFFTIIIFCLWGFVISNEISLACHHQSYWEASR
jgi:hypothetical protein